MLMISSRENFWDSETLSNSDEIRDVVLDGEGLGEPIGQEEFINRLRNRRVLFLIHGYNNEEDDVVRAYDIIERNVSAYLGNMYDEIVGYTWPGGDDRFDYYSAKTRSGAVAPRVRRWLRDIVYVAQALDIMDHSMGTRVSLTALRDPRASRVRNLFNMASAVDNECIQRREKYYPATQNCETLYVFHSKNDDVLRTAYVFAHWDRALGYNGPEDPAAIIEHSPNVKVVNCKNVIQEHGDYKYSEEIYQFIGRELVDKTARQYSTLE